jgi:predicted Zn-dependent peptidase
MEATCYYAKVMDTHLETMIDILSDIFLNSRFDPDEIERERPVIFQEIGMIEDSPEEYIHFLSGKTYWGDAGLGRSILGTKENIIDFDAETIRSFFIRKYQPDRIIISAAGNLVHEHLVELVGPLFETIQTGNGFPDRITPVGRYGMEIQPREIEQTHICLMTKGLSLTDPKRYAFSLLNTLIGGNMSSRLFQEIRERRGLAYAVYSFASSYADTGMFGAYAGVDSKHVCSVVELILKELLRFKVERIDSAALSDAKEYSKGSLMLATESVDNQMVRLAQNEIHFECDIPLEAVLEHIDAVRPEEIEELAEALFQTHQLALAILGPVEDTSDFESILSF